MGKRLKKAKEALTHPISAASSAVAAFGALLNPDFLLAGASALYASAPSLFTGSSIAAFTLPQVFPALAVLKPVFLAVVAIAGPLYLLRLGIRSRGIFEEKL